MKDRLATMLGTYPKTRALKEGAVTSSSVALDIAPVETAQKAFKDVVRDHAFDVAELAIMTFLQGHEAGAPYVMLPYVMNGGFHHKSILCRASDSLGPRDLAGKRVAMRAYTQTTPTWVRGILSDEYGVALESVQWLNQEGAHVANYEEPAFVTRIESNLGLEAMLLAGEVDAIISGGAASGDAGVRPLIADPKRAALEWYRRTGVVPINHIVAIKRDLAENGDVVREVYRMLAESRAAANEPVPEGPELQPRGFAALESSLAMAIRYAHEQQLIRKPYTAEELYGPVLRALA